MNNLFKSVDYTFCNSIECKIKENCVRNIYNYEDNIRKHPRLSMHYLENVDNCIFYIKLERND